MKSSSSSRRAASTDIPDHLSPLLPIIPCLRQVFWVTSRVLTIIIRIRLKNLNTKSEIPCRSIHFKIFTFSHWASNNLYIYMYIQGDTKNNRTHIFLTEIHKFNSSYFFFHNFCAKHSRWLKLFGIIIPRQKFECTKLELFCYIFIEVIKRFMGSVFVGVTPYI